MLHFVRYFNGEALEFPITQVRLPFLVSFTHKSDATDLFSSSVLYVGYAYAHTDDFSVRGVVYIW
jgi:hypothetical protein